MKIIIIAIALCTNGVCKKHYVHCTRTHERLQDDLDACVESIKKRYQVIVLENMQEWERVR